MLVPIPIDPPNAESPSNTALPRDQQSTLTELTLANYETALGFGAVNSALGTSLMLGVSVATIGVLVIAVLVWIIYRSRVPGHGLIEYVVMFPQAVPRMVFGLGLLWAWLNIPIPIYGTLWLLALAYFTVLMPLGVRTLSSSTK